ncbi:MobA/MobL family protein [Sphingomonas leidyi]|uniref:MobA/MobL family protein n=1 Tax=Sphingomonas leidyi TaxID=68569 RepID=UPI0036D2AF5A
MAIYSCNLASVGRTTHAAGTAGAHLRYITRDGAQPTVEAHGIPLDPAQAATWMDREERGARSNARLIDKLRVAIPRELSPEERQALVRDFVRDLTGDRVPWMFAIHQSGEDAHNPHAHIVLRDRDPQTGKRVLRLSDSARDREKAGLVPKAVEWIRERWEHHANLALERAGHDTRIDRRSLEAQGIERAPTIHIGPRAQHVEEHVHRAESKTRTNALGREIDYPAIDKGRTRKDRNAEIVDLNLERASRSPDAETRLRALFEREQGRLDRQLESELTGLTRKRTQEERALKKDFRTQEASLKSERRDEYNSVAGVQREALRGKVRALRDRQRDERTALKGRQSSLWSRFRRAVDWTGNTRRRHIEARRVQVAAHKGERHALAAESRAAWRALRDGVAGRFAPCEHDLAEQKRLALSAMRDMHRRGEAQADAKRQLRERAREEERRRLEEEIRLAKTLAQRPSPAQNASSDTKPVIGRERQRTAFSAVELQSQISDPTTRRQGRAQSYNDPRPTR